MGRQTYSIARPGFIVDADSIARNTGRQVDWERVPSSYGADGNKVIEGSTIMSLTAEGKVIPRKAAGAAVTNLSASGGTATAVAAGHSFKEGDKVTITGSDDYSGTHEVTGVTADNFTFEIDGEPDADTDGATAGIAANCVLLTNAAQNSKVAAINGQGVILGGVLFENLMVDHEEDDFENWKAELKEAGTGFVFEQYSDNR